MKAQDLNIADLIDFEAGKVALKGRRLLIHDLWALGQFRKDLIETTGEEIARRILTRKGLFWGQADAAGMQRLYKWDTQEEWIKAVTILPQIAGMARMELKKLSLDPAAGTVAIEVRCTASAEVEQHQEQFGFTEKRVCWVIAGYLSGYVSYCMGESVYFRELQCQALGADSCLMEGKDAASWGSGIEGELLYFRTVDMQKKVRELTLRLRDQQRLLIMQRRQLQAMQRGAAMSGAEVRSKAFQDVLFLAAKAAKFDATVLITGETGTGKEVLARHIHALSSRKGGPFVAINCSALPEHLLESELFGHEKGAFTGAGGQHTGLFKAAEGGTVFLDEIGEMPPELQTKLLRTLQFKEVRPVGATRTDTVDIRIISATNSDLPALIREKKFREDLFYRLQVVHIALPPLRERVDDILPLARFFLETFSKRYSIGNLRLSPAIADILRTYRWPGNVRELENTLEQAAVLCTDGQITPELLPGTVTECRFDELHGAPPQALADVERRHIEQVLSATKGNQAQAARILGIGESTLYRRLRKYASS